jgi:hypothetical protein
MRKLLVILLIALATCATFEESSDDNVILEKSGFSIKSPVPHVTPKINIPKTSKINIPKTSKIFPKTNVIKTNVIKTNVIKTNVIKTNVIKTNVIKTNVVKTNVIKTNVIKTNVIKTNVIKTDRVKNLNEVKKIPVKGINGLFGGKVGEIFRKLGDMVKKGIAWLKKNKLWDPIIEKLKELGQKYGNELCEKALPPEVCGPAIDFALDHLLPSGQK